MPSKLNWIAMEMLHKRRKRYSGTHPRNFKERYKELNPELFPEQVEKIIGQGRTPAGQHIPIMVEQVLNSLCLCPGAKGIDATLGYGGHARAILEKIGLQGCLWGLDQDGAELSRTQQRLNALGHSNFTTIDTNFSAIKEIHAKQIQIPLDFVFADLGLSSMQIDDPERGFSIKVDGPLDMRMNQKRGTPVSHWLSKLNCEELSQILRENSDEPRAERLAAAIIDAHKGSPLLRTLDLRKVIEREMKKWPVSVQREQKDKPIRRVFQAVRMEINGEMAALEDFLQSVPTLLKAKGCVAVLSFHSGEDRRVKKSFLAGFRSGVYSSIAPDPICADAEELRANPRSSSAKLRWAVKG